MCLVKQGSPVTLKYDIDECNYDLRAEPTSNCTDKLHFQRNAYVRDSTTY